MFFSEEKNQKTLALFFIPMTEAMAWLHPRAEQ
jgi:hypothetical protein